MLRLVISGALMSAPPVRIRDLHYAVGTRPIFAGVDIDVPQGQITAVMGPSGTGKTTLLRLLTGQVAADRGRIELFGESVGHFFGESVGHLDKAGLYALRRRTGMLFQNGALLTDLTVFENVAFPVRAHARLPESVLRRLVLTKLEAVGLRGAAELMPSQLSGGMARRVALARAIVMDPELLIYDEPFVGLDPISMGVIVRLIRELNETLGVTSIVVSHDVEELATIAHRSYLLSEGRVVASGTPDELARSEEPVVRQFMSGAADGPVPFHFPAGDLATDILGQAEQARSRS
jgi:phospholipid/cholesterol/gamma-HCH transport system ATP-binding protein